MYSLITFNGSAFGFIIHNIIDLAYYKDLLQENGLIYDKTRCIPVYMARLKTAPKE